MTRRHASLALSFVLAAALLAGCGDDGPPATAAAEVSHEAPAAMPAARGVQVRVVRSRYGRILADARGQALYLFQRETDATPRCYGACAEAWPPVFAKGRPGAGGGARAAEVGVTRRRDGRRQVTYAGRPVYFYVGDAPGRVLCHDVTEYGGRWVVIRPDGTPVP